MKFAFVTTQFDSMGMAHRLVSEGHTVDIWCKMKPDEKPRRTAIGTGFDGITIYSNRQLSLEEFVRKNKNNIVIFDGSEYGRIQDEARKAGYRIIGSSSFGERVEKDRAFGLEFARGLGINVPESHEVKSAKEAVEFIKKNPAQYILKQSGSLPKSLNWKAFKEDSSDLIDHIKVIEKKNNLMHTAQRMVLQKFVEGTEVAVSAWFDGNDWIRQSGTDNQNLPAREYSGAQAGEILLQINFENKKLLHGDRGISTGELGTGFYFRTGENELFKQMLKPLTDTLMKANHVGCVDANCIYDGKDIALLEHTIRFGYPVSDGNTELLNEELGAFFTRLASSAGSEGGNPDNYCFNLNDKGIVLALGFPTYPYEKAKENTDNFKDEAVYLDNLTDEEMESVHLGQVMYDCKANVLRIADEFGYFGNITGKGNSFAAANETALAVLEKIEPSSRGFYRTDIDDCVEERFKKVKNII
jgi:phosphoribosylamine-glycine ligase